MLGDVGVQDLLDGRELEEDIFNKVIFGLDSIRCNGLSPHNSSF